MKNLAFIIALTSLNALAQPVCERLKGGIVDYLSSPESRISFHNEGGLLNGGVCWWHSRLQRASAYLVEFRPELNAPNSIQLKSILKSLRSMNQVVIIPGFENFYDFSQTYQEEMQKLLEAWQREDGFINQQWVRGISGKYELPADQMKDRMNAVYEQFMSSPHPIWVMAQIKGIESHAFLVLSMEVTGPGYELKVIDSNDPSETKVFNFEFGQRYLKHPNDSYSFVPYIGFQKDFDSINAGIKNFCGTGIGSGNKKIPMGSIEVSH